MAAKKAKKSKKSETATGKVSTGKKIKKSADDYKPDEGVKVGKNFTGFETLGLSNVIFNFTKLGDYYKGIFRRVEELGKNQGSVVHLEQPDGSIKRISASMDFLKLLANNQVDEGQEICVELIRVSPMSRNRTYKSYSMAVNPIGIYSEKYKNQEKK